MNTEINLHFASKIKDKINSVPKNDIGIEPDNLNSENGCIKDKNSIHLLPCFIDYNGEASIENYFNKYISTKENPSTGQKEYTGSFRGYPLKGREVSSPEGFIFALMKETKVDDQESRTLKECEKFEDFICWNVSDIPTTADPLFKALKWVDTAKIIHED